MIKLNKRLKVELLLSTCLLTGTLSCVLVPAASANPLDGTVSAGQATISSSGKKLNIHQQSQRAVIDWRGFDIAPDEHTQFHQPDSRSVTLNRVNSGRASRIDGRITANGNVVIVNQNGVVFGRTANVDVNGLVATTADISNKNFMRGKMKFDRAGNPNAAIVNEGTITARQAGLVGLVAPNVKNSGVINARLGRVHLGAGDTTTVDFYGDKLLEIAVSKKVKSQLVSNTGKINADGGQVALTAAAGRHIVDSLVSVSGEVNARTIGTSRGRVTINGSEGRDRLPKTKNQPPSNSEVLISGVIDASGRAAGEQGGNITLTGDHVRLTRTAKINASGHGLNAKSKAGGDIKIGGDYLGGGTTQTAKTLHVEKGAAIFNDALNIGDAGRTILWSDEHTSFSGQVYARGGEQGGHGGFLETSGKNNLTSNGFADLTASNGETGLWLLDPTNISIFNRSGSGDGTNTFTTAQLEAMSVSANVALNATNIITLDMTGDVMNFTTASRSFTMTAGNTITTASAGGITTNNGAINFNATNGVNINHTHNFITNGGAININNNLLLGAAQTFDSGGGAINTLGTVNGAHVLNLNAGTGTFTSTGVIGGSSALSGLNITADGIALGANVSGTGTLTITPGAIGTSIGLAGGAGTLNLDTTEIARLANGWSSLSIGRTDGTGAMTVNAATWNDPLTLSTGSGLLSIAGTQTMGANALTLQTDSNLTLTGALTGSTNLIIRPSSTLTSIGLGSGVGTLGLTAAEIALITNGWASITVGRADGAGALNAGALTWNDPLTLLTGSGVLSVTGTQTMAANALTLQTDSDISLTAALTGTGNLTLRPATASTTIGVAGGAGTLALSSADLANITNGWASITIGNAANTGAMTVNAATWNDILNLVSGSGIITVAGTQTMAANNLTLQTDANLALNAALTGTGTLTITPTTSTTSIGIGGAAGTLNLSAAELANITNGWASLVFGSTAGTGALTANAMSWNDAVTMRTSSGQLTINGTQTMAANGLTLLTDSDIALDAALTGTGTLIIAPTNIATTIGLAGAAGTLNVSAAELANITNGWASLVFGSTTGTGALNVNAASWNDALTLRSAGGLISINGAQSMAANNLAIQTNSNLALDAALTGTGTLTISPTTASTTMGLAGAAGTLNLSAAELANITNGWASQVFGNRAMTGALTVNQEAWDDNVTFASNTGVITIAGEQTTGTNNLTIQTNANPALNAPLTGTGTLSIVQATNATTIGLAGGAGTINLTSAEIDQFTNGWSSIIIGSATSTGAMTVNAQSWNDNLTLRSNTGVITVAGTQNVNANNLTLMTNADLAINADLTGTGTLFIQTQTAATTIGLAGGAGTVNLTSAEIARLTDGWSNIEIGAAVGTGAITANAQSWNDNLLLRSNTGAITIAGAQTMGANNLSFVTNANPALNAALTGSGTLSFSPQTATTTIGLAGGAGTLNLTSAEITQITDGWSSINFGSAAMTGAMALGTQTWNDALIFTTNTGVITVSGAQNFGANDVVFETNGNPAISANLTGAGALTIRPASAATTIGLAGGAGTLNLTSAELDFIQPGFASLNFGRSNGTGLMTLGAYTSWDSSVSLLNGSGNIALSGNQTLASDMSMNITPTSGLITTTGPAVLTASGTGGFSFARPLTLGNALTLNTDADGSVAFGGAVNGAFNLTANAGTLSFANALGGTTPLAAVSLTSVNPLLLPSITASSIFAQTTAASSDLTLDSTTVLTANGAGTPLTLVSGRNVINASGSGALNTPAGRWLIYSQNPDDDTPNGLTQNFRRFSCTYGGSCPTLGTGNGFLYAMTPMLTATATTQNVTYGNAANLNSYGYAISGYLGGDSGNDTLGGAINGTSSYNAGSNVGAYNINYQSGALTSSLGYGFIYANNSSGLQVGARTLNASLTGIVSKVYNATTAAVLGAGHYILANVFGGDDVALANNTAGTYDDKNAGTGKTVTVNGLTLTGISASNYILSSTSVSDTVGEITAASLNINGVTAANKIYDGLTTASLSNGSALLSGVMAGDFVNLDLSSSAAVFVNKNVGTAKIVTASGYSINGADSGNYVLSQPTGLTANITPASLNISGVTATGKIYDATTNASLANGAAVLNGVIGIDDVVLDVSSSTGTFANKNIGVGKTVTASGYAVTGSDSSNYTLSQPIGLSADIAPATLTISGITAMNKIYDGTLAAILSHSSAFISGILGSDSVALDTSTSSAAFADKNVGLGKSVTASGYALSGTDSGNYIFAQPSGLTADISPASLNIVANNLSREHGIINPAFSYQFVGLASGDTFAVVTGLTASTLATQSSPSGTYAITLGGASADNYIISYTFGTLTINALPQTNATDVVLRELSGIEFTNMQGPVALKLPVGHVSPMQFGGYYAEIERERQDEAN